MTANQWLALVISVWLFLSIILEILMALDMPWGDRRPKDDPPPIVGGLVFGGLATAAVAVVCAFGYALFWLWTN